ncbi:dipeptidase PepV [Sporosarcina sp. JAI121]|uniref:dipeptidase PepV n=1 Tax=Sporosarcina sp. JAI121 TaxID=2723064 RepID=UPI0015C9EB5A|nr:dipeptidase PepV [Sporosarcina sp. JAI121]NYF25218.1 succinyl-diaminopimelate desuccinylase [Sporosarcina sp. JAI121]
MTDWEKEALKRQENLLEDLQQLIAIPSVLDENAVTKDLPFGPEPKRALDWLLEEGRKAEMSVKNVDNMAGHIEMGNGDDIIGILCHVDVVPAGSNWTYGPYDGTIVDGKLFGRGAIDDKGPTIAAWHAMKLVKESGITLNKRVRLIIGTDEESGFRCVKRYFEKEEMPQIGFAPDADFPIINAEKGIASVLFKQKSIGADGQLLWFKSGNRTNMVPDYAEAHIAKEVGIDNDQFTTFLNIHNVTGGVTKEKDYTVINLNGKSAHAMEPDNGVNAAVLLASFLNRIFQEGTSKDFTQFMFNAFANESRGLFLGLAFNDEMSGDTTLNAGIVTYDQENSGEITISMRYSVSYQFEEKMTTCMERLTETPFSVDVLSNSAPHYVDAADPLIRTLQEVYTDHTGEHAELLSIGGGTYARVLEKGVAFGMLFPGREDVAHQADEYVYIDDLMKATAIYADAISRLACDETEGE